MNCRAFPFREACRKSAALGRVARSGRFGDGRGLRVDTFIADHALREASWRAARSGQIPSNEYQKGIAAQTVPFGSRQGGTLRR